MALTANPQSALPPALSWDETIVPALRKRLENESRVLAKRISATSIASLEDNAYANHYSPNASDHPQYDSSSPDPGLYRPSAIPRPSLQSARPSISDSTRPPTASSSRSSGTSGRARTHSQPKLLDRSTSSASKVSAPPMPVASRSASPNVQRSAANDAKPTRIPIPRTRTGSVSNPQPHLNGNGSGNGNGNGNGNANPNTNTNGVLRSDSRNGYTAYAAESSHDLRAVAEQREPTPVGHERGEPLDDLPRPSMDSEERPFEHWYRGEVSRNGGVGEYRVGRRMEMLEIANFGHKPKAPASGNLTESWQAKNARRRRAGSIGARARGSFYMEADGDGARVLDEMPLTDVEGGSDGEEEDEGGRRRMPPRSSSAMDFEEGRSVTPTNHARERAPPSRIPTPTMVRQTSDPPRTPTPTHAPAPSPAPAPAAASRPSQSRSQSTQRAQSSTPNPSTPNPKRRGKSPAAASPASAKKKPRASPGPQARRGRYDDPRRSIAEYPVPGGEDMSDAIPTWTQPVPPGGNWDEVVLPVVARKKGLDGHYTQADGSPRPKPRVESIPEPAPGTFGFDYSKYRPGQRSESIPMDEFGQRPRGAADDDQDDEAHTSTPRPLQDVVYEGRQYTRREPPPSPAPFAHYAIPAEESAGAHIPATTAQVSVDPELAQRQHHDEDDDGGCCKCVIM
ncbi:hypothetical protein OF83DRAFT_339026 [Amylostereum chailletii]|nr:hypothetical protein OF83DRAFT_339026 [Amylostereum chailletii]